MRGRLFGQEWRLFAVGAFLCLLAALFAFEAKLAWYSPAGTPCAQINATKPQLADAPKLIAQVLAVYQVSQHSPSEAFLLLAPAIFIALIPQAFARVGDEGFIHEVFPNASPHLFRRPPPQS